MESVQPEVVDLSTAGLDAIDAAVRARVDKGILAGALLLTSRHGKIARLRF